MECILDNNSYGEELYSTENHLLHNKRGSCCMYASSTIYYVHAAASH